MKPATADGKAKYALWRAGRPERAATLFWGGMDTLQIAHNFAVREATILRWITNERCQRLNLPNPYQSVKG